MTQYILNIMSEWVCIFSLVIRQANRILSVPHFIAMYGLSGCIIFFSILSHTRFIQKNC